MLNELDNFDDPNITLNDLLGDEWEDLDATGYATDLSEADIDSIILEECE